MTKLGPPPVAQGVDGGQVGDLARNTPAIAGHHGQQQGTEPRRRGRHAHHVAMKGDHCPHEPAVGQLAPRPHQCVAPGGRRVVDRRLDTTAAR